MKAVFIPFQLSGLNQLWSINVEIKQICYKHKVISNRLNIEFQGSFIWACIGREYADLKLLLPSREWGLGLNSE